MEMWQEPGVLERWARCETVYIWKYTRAYHTGNVYIQIIIIYTWTPLKNKHLLVYYLKSLSLSPHAADNK